ncbi:uncharacterized protein F5147DRAFT_66448 [Suillus discolor]|uniref:Uncharacterized protein n=1 Tax=Suillus discolor TaxID=1912936 RepID=A0A9P7ET06_9AGAM|nr:uncharacterized protein F5147DRAFT_66448 [Suillus discolor]KAG2087536.1 hypothetical protein F5147DRAFT_66448 [Suillus discolor]
MPRTATFGKSPIVLLSLILETVTFVKSLIVLLSLILESATIYCIHPNMETSTVALAILHSSFSSSGAGSPSQAHSGTATDLSRHYPCPFRLVLLPTYRKSLTAFSFPPVLHIVMSSSECDGFIGSGHPASQAELYSIGRGKPCQQLLKRSHIQLGSGTIKHTCSELQRHGWCSLSPPLSYPSNSASGRDGSVK